MFGCVKFLTPKLIALRDSHKLISNVTQAFSYYWLEGAGKLAYSKSKSCISMKQYFRGLLRAWADRLLGENSFQVGHAVNLVFIYQKFCKDLSCRHDYTNSLCAMLISYIKLKGVS